MRRIWDGSSEKTGRGQDRKNRTGVGKRNIPQKLQYHWQLDVYQLSVETTMEIYDLSKSFAKEEIYSLTDHLRRASRSISSQIAEGWRRSKYEAVFVNRMNEAEGEAAETQVRLEYSVKCEHMSRDDGTCLHRKCDEILGKLINMGNTPEKWGLKPREQR